MKRQESRVLQKTETLRYESSLSGARLREKRGPLQSLPFRVPGKPLGTSVACVTSADGHLSFHISSEYDSIFDVRDVLTLLESKPWPRLHSRSQDQIGCITLEATAYMSLLDANTLAHRTSQASPGPASHPHTL